MVGGGLADGRVGGCVMKNNGRLECAAPFSIGSLTLRDWERANCDDHPGKGSTCT